MPETEFPAGLIDCLAVREQQWQRDVAAALPDLERDLAAYLSVHAEDSALPTLLARMLREISVQAYVRGVRDAGGTQERIPRDSEIFWGALHHAREFEDICPAWRVFDGRHLEEKDDA